MCFREFGIWGFVWLRIFAATILLAGTTASQSAPVGALSLQDQVNQIVDLGYEEPQRALSLLNALNAQHGQTVKLHRMIETGIGLVAADSNLYQEARSAIAELNRLVPTAGAISHADALLVLADMEFGADETQKSTADITAAVSAYAPFCDPALALDTSTCNPFNWFYANMFAGVFISERESRGTATMYLSAAREIAARAHRPDLEARAMAFMAQLAQSEGNTELSDRVLRRADFLATESGQTSAQEFIKIFRSLILKARGNFAGALEALQQAQQIARRAGHSRRTNDLIVDVVDLELKMGHPEVALAAIERALPDIESRHVDYMKETLAMNRIVALLRMGRLQEGRRLLPSLLDALDAKVGLVERSSSVNNLGEALVAAGDFDNATALFDRERPSILAGSDRHFERVMIDRQAESQARQLAERRREIRWWSSIVGVAVLLLLAVSALVPWQRSRNRRLARANGTLREQSERDHLTGLLNRDGLLRGLRSRQRADAFTGTLLMVDIDHFKSINDTLGHAGGDAVLREVGQRLQSCVREGDLVARWGGEELVIAVLSTPFDADALVDRVMQALASAPVSFQQRSVNISASIGYATFPLDAPNVALPFDTSLAVTDAGMYYAKRNGRRAAVRITALPPALLDDLGGLPDALEREAIDGAVGLVVRRAAQLAAGSETAGVAPPQVSLAV